MAFSIPLLTAASGAIQSLLGLDVVAVYNQTFTQLFKTAHQMKAVVNESAKVMEHPVESGATITDFRIINPVEIELSLLLDGADFKDTYNAIKQEFLKSSLLVVQTKTASYKNMMIQAMPHVEEPAIFDTVTIGLKLKEVKLVEAQFGTLPPQAVKSAGDSSTVDGGQKQIDSAAPTKTLPPTWLKERGF